MKMKKHYKVPGRNIYCPTLRVWLGYVVEVYVVEKLRPVPVWEKRK